MQDKSLKEKHAQINILILMQYFELDFILII